MNPNAPTPRCPVLTEIPTEWKELAHQVLWGFYGVEEALIVDLLVKHPCLTESQLLEALKFEPNQLRAKLTLLIKERFVQSRQRTRKVIRKKKVLDKQGDQEYDDFGNEVEEDEEIMVPLTYYFFDYKAFVNIMMYKIYQMRKTVGAKEKGEVGQATFICGLCSTKYSETAVGRLLDSKTQSFICSACGEGIVEQVVEEDLPTEGSLMAKFNEQTQSIFDILKKSDGLVLTWELLEPKPDWETVPELLELQ